MFGLSKDIQFFLSKVLNSLNAKFAIIQKPVNWFAEQIWFLYDGIFGV